MAFLDFDNDGRLDLFVTRYFDWEIEHYILCGANFRIYCRPDKFGGTTNILYHNEGHGRFRDVSRASGIAGVKGKGLGVAFNDYDNDGFADIFVANDGMEQSLWHNNGDGTFTNRALEAGVAGCVPDRKLFGITLFGSGLLVHVPFGLSRVRPTQS